MAWERSSRAVYVVCGVVYAVYEVRQGSAIEPLATPYCALTSRKLPCSVDDMQVQSPWGWKDYGQWVEAAVERVEEALCMAPSCISTAGAGFLFLFLKKNPRLWTYISFAVVHRHVYMQYVCTCIL